MHSLYTTLTLCIGSRPTGIIWISYASDLGTVMYPAQGTICMMQMKTTSHKNICMVYAVRLHQ